MTSKHTAGNWRWIDTLSCSSVYAGNPERRLVSYVSPSEEDRANARLIAAAPELLEALKRAAADWRLDDMDARQDVLAAIAKATGQ